MTRGVWRFLSKPALSRRACAHDLPALTFCLSFVIFYLYLCLSLATTGKYGVETHFPLAQASRDKR